MTQLQESGVRFERKATVLGPQERLRPIRDQIVLRPAEWEPSRVIQIAGNKRKALRGTVLAVGPGTYPWKYNKDRSKRWRSNHFLPTIVEVGDFVELGGLEIGVYDFQTVLQNGEPVIICSEGDIAMILERPESGK